MTFSPGQLLSDFISYPVKTTFEGQEEGEKIVLLLRQHWVTNIPWIFLTITGIVISLILFSYLSLVSPTFWEIISPFQLGLTWLWFVLIFGFIFERFLYWYFNVYIVTTERIIDFDFYGLLYKKISEARLDKIQDVHSKVGGLWHLFFNFGDVFVQTAAEVPEFDFYNIPNPDQAVRVISQLLDKE